MTWHHTDARPPARSLTVLAGLTASGLLSRTEAAAALARPGQPASTQTRQAWALADAEAEWRRERRLAVWAVRDALAPLLARRACRQTLWDAAVAADRHAVLLPAERRRLLEAEVARTLQRTRR